MKQTRYLLALMGAVLWTALILMLYYWVHKPITPALFSAVGGAVLDLAVTFFYIALSGGFGRRLLSRLDFSAWSLSERIAGPALIGLGALSLLILLVGSVALQWWSMIGLALSVLALVWRDMLGWLRDLKQWLSGKLSPSRWERFLAIAALALVFVALALALLPPTKWDVLTYHMVEPEDYVRHGRFYAVPHNHFLGFPQLVETLFAAPYAITGRLTVGGPFHWGIGVLMLLMTGGYTARHMNRAAGWLAVMTLLVSATIWLEMTFAYVDLMLMGLSSVAFAVIDRIVSSTQTEGNPVQQTVQDSPSPVGAGLETHPDTQPRSPTINYLFLLGAILGLAIGVKYTAIWMAAAFGLWVLWHSRLAGSGTILRNGMIVAGAALIVSLPWLVRNTRWYDNPVYPFVFETADMDHIRQDWYSQPESGLIYSPNKAWQIPILPLTAAIFGVESGGDPYSADIGPLFAMLLPLLPLIWGRLTAEERAVIRRALFIAGGMTCGWMLSASFGSYINIQTRLVLYIFPLLAVVAGITLESLRRLPEKPLNLGFILRAIVALVITFALINGLHMGVVSGIHVYFSGSDDYENAYLDYALGWHSLVMHEISDLPAGSSIRFLWEPRTLYCAETLVHCRPDSLMDGWYYARRTIGDPAEIAERWRADGSPDYLLVYEFGRRYEQDNNALYDPSDWAAWDQFVANHLVEVQRWGPDDRIQYILYRWQNEGF